MSGVNGLSGNPHYVKGRMSRADNPHLYRLAKFKGEGRDLHIVAHSGYVSAWLKKLPPIDAGCSDTIAPHAARRVQLINPEYRTHAQLMAEMFRAADWANKKKPPLEWHPISPERAEQVRQGPEPKPRWGNRSTPAWTEAQRARAIEVAIKRGDIIAVSE